MNASTALKYVISVLPGEVNQSISMLKAELRSQIREILLRTGKPVMLSCADGLYFLGNYGRAGRIRSPDSIIMTEEMMRRAFMNMCDDSVYSYMDNINSGYLTLAGGSRVGVCGRFVSTGSGTRSVRDISSLMIRIPNEFFGISDGLMRIYRENGLGSTVIAGSPCSGKTTFLRDLCRNLSDGALQKSYKVSLIDERCEISGADKNDSVFNVGLNTDIYLNYEKSEAIIMSVRTMSPEVIIFDEVGGEKEVLAIKEGMNSGVDFMFSIHADCYSELCKKEQYKLLLANTHIRYIVFLDRENPGKIKEVLSCDENNDFDTYFSPVGLSRSYGKKQGTPPRACSQRDEEIAT